LFNAVQRSIEPIANIIYVVIEGQIFIKVDAKELILPAVFVLMIVMVALKGGY
jgi:hypothetical protein